MGDNYYNNNPPYGQPRPNSASQQYIPPGAQQQQGGYNPANYGGPPPSERYSPYRAGDGYGGAQQVRFPSRSSRAELGRKTRR